MSQLLNLPELTVCLKIALFCVGLHAATWQGMILSKPVQWARLYALPDLIRKPLYDCLPCMGSIWTIALVTLGTDYDILRVLIAIPIVSGINTIFEALLTYSRHNPLNVDYGDRGN